MVNTENNVAIHSTNSAHIPVTQASANKKACPGPIPILRTKPRPKVVHLGRTPETEQKAMKGGRERGGAKGNEGGVSGEVWRTKSVVGV